MKRFFEDMINFETLLTIVIALLLGLFIGVFFQTGYSVGIRTFIHNLYIKINPDTQKDAKSLIIDRVTKDTPNLPQKDIFETTDKKDNNFVIFVKRLFAKPQQKEQTINDVIIN